MLKWEPIDNDGTHIAEFDIESEIGAYAMGVSLSVWDTRDKSAKGKWAFAIMIEESLFYMGSEIETVELAKERAVAVLEDYGRSILKAIGRYND